jgi:hypothetical protein
MSFRLRRVLLLARGFLCLFCVLCGFLLRPSGAQTSRTARPPASAESQGLSAQLEIGGATISVNVSAARTDLPASQILDWVERAARAVSIYYGRFPVAAAKVLVIPVRARSGVFGGTSYGEPSVLTRIHVGEHTTQAELEDDWMMTHELVHLAFPGMPHQHHWIEEGIATYVEPIARAQAGQISASRVWKELVEGLPKGEPEADDRGLDNTHTWGRIYWGGALYCLMADVEIRRRTQNRKGLEDALRAIVIAGGTIEADWSIERALAAGDAATGASVLIELYNRMKAAPAPVDLPDLWRQLGVEYHRGDVSFKEDAPLAAVRRAITAPRAAAAAKP